VSGESVVNQFPLVDADTHFYEPEDCFTRHLEARYLDRAVHVERRPGHPTAEMRVGDAPLRFLPRYPTDDVARPGSLTAFFRGDVPRAQLREDRLDGRTIPAFIDRDARLDHMDSEGVEAAIVFPSLGGCDEPQLRKDVELLHAHFRAFNRWVEDDWGYAYRARLFAVPLLTLADPVRASVEVDHVLAAGARVVHLQAMPVNGRSPADPKFDPFWARVAEAGVPVAVHVGDSGYGHLASRWGEEPEPPIATYSAFQRVVAFMDRPIMDMLAALVLHNLFGRHPDLRILSVENGSAWVPYLLHAIDHAAVLSHDGPWLGGRIEGRPSDIFREHIYVSPFAEDDLDGLVSHIGVDRVLLGSDYPHAEGVASAAELRDKVAGWPETESRMVLRGNAATLLGIASS